MNNRQQGGSGNAGGDHDRPSEPGRKGADERQQHQQHHGRGQQGGGFESEVDRALEGGRKAGEGAPETRRAAQPSTDASGRKGEAR